MSTYTGTFIYTVDVSALTVTPSPSDISSTYFPIVNTGGSFTVLTPTVVPLTTDTFYTVTVPFTYVDSVDASDGLSFTNITDTDAQSAVYTITHFAGIPLSRGTNQFAYINNISFSYVDASVPTILSNTSLEGCFRSCDYFDSSLNTWTDTSNVVDMNNMFNNATAFNKPLDNWNTSNVLNMSGMFFYATAFNQSLNTWNTSKVVDMNSMFTGTSAFDQSLNAWNTSNVTNMSYMFNSTTAFNGSINDWNTSKVTNMGGMFNNATAFNQPLNNWNTGNVTNMSYMFFNIAFNQSLNTWNTINVTDMNNMFANTTAFNQSLNAWNTSNVNDMSFMFNSTTTFNGSISNWNTSKVTNMGGMFSNAIAFNQQISYNSTNNYWDTSGVTNMDYMFNNATLFNNGGGSGDTTHPMNWIVTNVPVTGDGMPTNFLTNSSLTYTGTTYNSPFTYIPPPEYSGTFIYTVDVTGISPNPTYSDILTTYFPIVNTGTSFTVLTPTVDPVTTSTFYTVTVPFTYADSGNTSDGLNFYNNITNPDARNAAYTVTKFDGIPLSRSNQQFSNIPNLTFSYADASVPRILSNTSMVNGFAYCSNFNSPLNTWNTINLVNMGAMFYNATAFNQPLNDLNTSNVILMNETFNGATAFNQPLNTWNTSNVVDMYGMFNGASAFNQNISYNPTFNYWNTTNVGNMSSMFSNATLFNNGGGSGDTTHPMNWIVTNVFVIDGFPPNFLVGSSLTYTGTTYNSPFPIPEPPPPPPVICFLEGTKLLCFIDEKEVYVPIQHISRGTLVKTLHQGYKPVELIGFSKLYNPGNTLHSKNRLYKCSPKQYPELTEDLIITGCHSILVDKITDIERVRTINYLGLLFFTEKKYRLMACLDEKAEPYAEEGIHTIWHLALENDDYYMNYGIYANGLLVETTSIRMMKELSGMELV